MNRYLLILLLFCNIFAQDKKHNENIQQLAKNMECGHVEEIIPYLRDIQNKNKDEIQLIMNLFWKHNKIFKEINNKEISQLLCSAILEVLAQKEIEDSLQILMLKILSVLDIDIVTSSEEQLFQLVIRSIENQTPLSGNIFEYFILQQKKCFPDIAALVAKNNHLDSNIIKRILQKYDSKHFWKRVLENLQQNEEKMGVSIILGLESAFKDNCLQGLKLTTALLQNDTSNTINQETIDYILMILESSIEEYIKNKNLQSLDSVNTLTSIFELAQKNSPDISNFLLSISSKFRKEIFVEQNVYKISLYIYPLIIEKIKSNPKDYLATELLLSLNPEVLIEYKSELKSVFSKNIADLNGCLIKLLLKNSAFIDFFPILLNNPNKNFDNLNLFDIFKIYQTELFTFYSI